jgi:hypothetical protein
MNGGEEHSQSHLGPSHSRPPRAGGSALLNDVRQYTRRLVVT